MGARRGPGKSWRFWNIARRHIERFIIWRHVFLDKNRRFEARNQFSKKKLRLFRRVQIVQVLKIVYRANFIAVYCTCLDILSCVKGDYLYVVLFVRSWVMYVNRNHLGLVDGQRISYGDVPRDDGKRTRLAAPTVEAVALEKSRSAIASGEKPKIWRTGPCLKKWGLAKYLRSNNNNRAVNGGGKLSKDALKSISTDEDGVDSYSRRSRRALNAELSFDSYNNNNNINKKNNNSDDLAYFKRKFAEGEASSTMAAKRRRIACALAKQNIKAEISVQSFQQPACDGDGVATLGMYTCTEVQSSGLKLRLTKVVGDVGSSSRKRKRVCWICFLFVFFWKIYCK